MMVDAHNLQSIFSMRALWEKLDPAAAPAIATLKPPAARRNVALLPGSFNPPTAAHMLLAERALQEGFDCVILLLARNTVGKQPSGLIPEDRLLAMRALTGGSFGVGASSHGLYADQAEAAQALYPEAEITFLVGSDKVEQIFDPRWYNDPDRALERLFGSARLVVAPRADQDELLRSVLDAPQNRRFADRVSILRLHPAVSDLSSTRVRGMLRSGAEPSGLVPPRVAELLTAMRAFAPPIVIKDEEVDAYGIRTKIIEMLWRARGPESNSADLHELVTTALSATPAGSKLRETLANGGSQAFDLMRARASGL
ncbi:MAG TPA: nicotinate-nicotinamide nucleotide adenylyltransferase [Actinomycetota bacterium]|nr:nicotinate-nicotinamide nucleotide adenylyltransferase [Actinomycetota bacterium]